MLGGSSWSGSKFCILFIYTVSPYGGLNMCSKPALNEYLCCVSYANISKLFSGPRWLLYIYGKGKYNNKYTFSPKGKHSPRYSSLQVILHFMKYEETVVTCNAAAWYPASRWRYTYVEALSIHEKAPPSAFPGPPVAGCPVSEQRPAVREETPDPVVTPHHHHHHHHPSSSYQPSGHRFDWSQANCRLRTLLQHNKTSKSRYTSTDRFSSVWRWRSERHESTVDCVIVTRGHARIFGIYVQIKLYLKKNGILNDRHNIGRDYNN